MTGEENESERAIVNFESVCAWENIEEVKENMVYQNCEISIQRKSIRLFSTCDRSINSLASQYALYPDGYAFELRTKVAKHLGVKAEQLLFGSGLDEVIQMISRALLHEGTNVVMANPTFSQYHHHAVIEGAEVREVSLKDGIHDLDAMLEQVDEKTKIVWICNPNNPTGTYVEKQKLLSF